MKFTDYFLLLKFVSLFSLEMAYQKQRFFFRPMHYLNFMVSSKFEKLCKFEKKYNFLKQFKYNAIACKFDMKNFE